MTWCFSIRIPTFEYQSVGRDITDRKWAEEKITYLASFTEMNPHAVIDIGIDGKIHYSNLVSVQMFPDLFISSELHPLFIDLKTPVGTGKCKGHEIHNTHNTNR